MNAAVAYLTPHYERLALERLDVPRSPACLLLTPRFRESRHIVVLVLGRDGRRPALVAKLPRVPGDDGALEREAHNLRLVETSLRGTDRGTVPALLAFEPHPDYPLLLETALCGQPLSPGAVRRDRDAIVTSVAGWLGRLAAATLTTPSDGAWYERLVAAPLRALARGGDARMKAMAERTFEHAESLRSAGLPLAFEHGDLGHPNLLRQSDDRLAVLDWERAEPAGLPAHDLIFFLAYVALASRRHAGERDRLAALHAAFFGPSPWAWRVADRYADQLGIDRALLPSLLAVCCARTVAAGDASDRMWLLWRWALRGVA